MPMELNAAKAYREVKEKYIAQILDYATGVFPAVGEENRWTSIRNYLSQIWSQSDNPETSLFAKPIIEALFKYESSGRTPRQLVDDNVLHPSMLNFIEQPDRCLYRHQLDAITASRTHNIVVASGTGSGKTECFLYSMLNKLLQTETAETLQAGGVRILMIYPMNALVNDQLKRILRLVGGRNPSISVGMYTGLTPENQITQPQAILNNLNEWERTDETHQLPNYRRSREEIRRDPPNILITNYSMLEYAMLRNRDSHIFEGEHLQAIVFDEAHFYSGVLGNDIHMLLRRVLQRFNKTTNDIRFYATSATIGDNSPERLRSVGTSLWGVNANTICPITGFRVMPQVNDNLALTLQMPAGEPAIPDELQNRARDLKRRYLTNCAMPGHDWFQLSDADLETLADIPLAATDGNGEKFLPYKLHVFVDSPNRLYSDLAISEDVPLGNLKRSMLFDDGAGVMVFGSNNTVHDFYFKGLLFRENGNYILRGDSATLPNGREVFFRLATPRDEEGMRHYRMTRMPRRDEHVAQSNVGWNVEAAPQGPFVFALRTNTEAADAFDNAGSPNPTWYSSDGKKMHEFSGADVGMGADRGGNAAEQGQTNYSRSNMMIPLGFVSPKLRSVMFAEQLFPYLPDASNNQDYCRQRPWNGRQMLFFSDGRGHAAGMSVALQNIHQTRMIQSYLYRLLEQANNALSLSDICDRLWEWPGFKAQLALPQNCYRQIRDHEDREAGYNGEEDFQRVWQLPGLVFQTLAVKRSGERVLEGLGAIRVSHANVDCDGNEWENLCNYIAADEGECETYWNEHILPDLVDLMRQGRKVFCIDFWAANSNVADANQAYNHIRNHPNWRNLDNAKFHRKILQNALGYIYSDLNGNNGLGMFLSLQSLQNSPTYSEFFQHHFINGEDQDSRNNAAQALYRFIEHAAGNPENEDLPRSLFVRNPTQNGIALNGGKLRFSVVPEGTRIYADRRTNRVVSDNGNPDADRYFEVTQYIKRSPTREYLIGRNVLANGRFDPSGLGGLRTPEHSAQLKSEELGELEELFKNHKINVFSCTPTMEVGVDIGGLSAVLLDNLPPEKANYVQRAGRAGRGSDHSALVLTFLKNAMLDAEVLKDSSTVFERDNLFAESDVARASSKDQIRQHVNQFLLSEFFKVVAPQPANNPIGLVGLAAGGNHDKGNPVEAWSLAGNLLARRPVLQTYRGIVQAQLQNAIQGTRRHHRLQKLCDEVNSYLDQMTTDDPLCNSFLQTIQGIINNQDDNSRTFSRHFNEIVEGTSLDEPVEHVARALQTSLSACSEQMNGQLQGIIAALNSHEFQEIQPDDRRDRAAMAYYHQFMQIYEERLIEHLIHQRVLPAYGFPIDVRTFSAGEHQLERDVFTALKEFTPGNQIVVAHEQYPVNALTGNFYTQRGYYQRFFMGRCPVCGTYVTPEIWEDVTCPGCNRQLVYRPQQNNLSDVRNAPADAEPQEGNADRVNVTEYRAFITPEGYKSNSSGEDAASSGSGKRFAMIENQLLLNQVLGQVALPNGEPAQIYYPRIEEMGDVYAISINLGPYGLGYIIDNTTGEITPRRRPADHEHIFHDEDINWINQRDQHNLLTTALACKSKVSVWSCLLSSNYAPLGTNSQIQELFSIALHVEATKRLNLDSRVLMRYIQQQGGGASILFCLYDLSGNNGYVYEIYRKRDEIVSGALDRLRLSRTTTGRVVNLLNYANERELAKFSDANFEEAAGWATNYADAIIYGAYEAMNCGRTENGQRRVNVEKVRENSNPLYDTPNADITVLLKEWTPDLLNEGSLFNELLTRQNVTQLTLLVDSFSNLAESARVNWGNDIAAVMRAKRNLSVHNIDFANTELDTCYEDGLRFKVGGKWHLLPSKESRMSFDESSPMERDWLRNVYRVSDDFDIEALVNEENRIHHQDALVSYPPVLSQKGVRFSQLKAADIWSRLGIAQNAEISQVEILDSYFWTPIEWKTLFVFLSTLSLTEEATVTIKTWNPKLKFPNDSAYYHLYGNVSDVVCSQGAWKLLELEDAEQFAEYLRQHLEINSVRINYLPDQPTHDRFITLTVNGQRIEFQFGKGFDFLDYKAAGQRRLFTSQADDCAVYTDRTTFVRITP